MLGYNHDLVFSLFLNEIFSRELSQPLPKRLMHGTALMNSRCAGHRKHTLAPWYSSRGTCSSTARELQLSGPASGQLHLSPLGTWAPNPELSTHLSLSHWEWWEYLQRSPGFVFFLEAKMVERQISSQLRPHFPFTGTCSSSHSLAPYPWLPLPCSGLPAAAKAFWSLSALRWVARARRGFFAIPVASHQSPNQSCLACLVGTGRIFYLQKPQSTDSHRSFSAACLCLFPFCLKEEKQ